MIWFLPPAWQLSGHRGLRSGQWVPVVRAVTATGAVLGVSRSLAQDGPAGWCPGVTLGAPARGGSGAPGWESACGDCGGDDAGDCREEGGGRAGRRGVLPAGSGRGGMGQRKGGRGGGLGEGWGRGGVEGGVLGGKRGGQCGERKRRWGGGSDARGMEGCRERSRGMEGVMPWGRREGRREDGSDGCRERCPEDGGRRAGCPEGGRGRGAGEPRRCAVLRGALAPSAAPRCAPQRGRDGGGGRCGEQRPVHRGAVSLQGLCGDVRHGGN